MNRSAEVIRLVVVVIVIWAGYSLYQRWNSLPADEQAVRTAMAQKLSRQVSLALPIPPGRPKVTIAPVVGDYYGLMAQQLIQAVERRNVSVVDIAPWNSAIPARLQWVTEKAPESSATDAAKLNVPYLISCRVIQWSMESGSDKGELTVEVSLIDVQQRTIIYQNQLSLSDLRDISQPELH